MLFARMIDLVLVAVLLVSSFLSLSLFLFFVACFFCSERVTEMVGHLCDRALDIYASAINLIKNFLSREIFSALSKRTAKKKKKKKNQ